MTSIPDQTSRSKPAKSKAVISASKFAAYVAAGTAAGLGLVGNVEADITVITQGTLLLDTTANDSVNAQLRLKFGDSNSFNVDFMHSIGAGTMGGFALARGNLFGGLDPGIEAASIAGKKIGNFYYVSNLGTEVSLKSVTNWILGTPPLAFATMAAYGGAVNGASQFLQAGLGYLGVRFNNGSGFSYGWVRVDMNGSPLNSFTVVDYAYGDPNETVFVGEAIPEPGSLACLALGSVGLGFFRRRKVNV